MIKTKRKKRGKKLYKKTLKKSKLRKGGTFYDIKPGQLKEMIHIGEDNTPGQKLSCVACALNQIGFPEDLVNTVARTVNSRGAFGYIGYPSNYTTEIVNKLQAESEPDAPRAEIYYWYKGRPDEGNVAVSSGADSLSLPRELTAARYFQSLFDTMYGILAIIGIMPNGSSALLAMGFVNSTLGPPTGHMAVIAKSINGTPYLIESQGEEARLKGVQGVYRGIDSIMVNYFDKLKMQVGYFKTWNNSKPTFSESLGKWTLKYPDVQIKLDPESDRLQGRYNTPRDRRLTLVNSRLSAPGPPSRQDSFTSRPSVPPPAPLPALPSRPPPAPLPALPPAPPPALLPASPPASHPHTYSVQELEQFLDSLPPSVPPSFLPPSLPPSLPQPLQRDDLNRRAQIIATAAVNDFTRRMGY